MNLVLENVEPTYVPVFKALAKSLHIKVRKEENVEKKTKRKLTAEQQEFVDGMKQSLKEVELHQQGKIKLPTFEEMMNEL
jgi:hypothetical protein